MKLVFLRSNTTACRFIRAIDVGAWSHCAVADFPVFHPVTGWASPAVQQDTCIEAVYRHGVRRRSLAGLLRDRPDHQVLEITLPRPEEAGTWLARQVDKPYDTSALPALAIQRLTGHTPRLATPGAWYCAELLLGALRAGGVAIDGPLHRYGVAAAWALAQKTLSTELPA